MTPNGNTSNYAGGLILVRIYTQDAAVRPPTADTNGFPIEIVYLELIEVNDLETSDAQTRQRHPARTADAVHAGKRDGGVSTPILLAG